MEEQRQPEDDQQRLRDDVEAGERDREAVQAGAADERAPSR